MSLVTEHLIGRGVRFEVIPHRRAFTSIQEARELGVAADEVLKTVGLRSKGKYVLAVVPASRRLELRLVRESLDDPDARLASEAELAADFPGYELGALPPLGSLLGVPLLVDPEVLEHGLVVRGRDRDRVGPGRGGRAVLGRAAGRAAADPPRRAGQRGPDLPVT
jgi:prolyl-tRNA editing enzyme YbaK/EbsC (Cys-tRNA(Pro) deacylase)